MTLSHFNQFIFVDFENVPTVDLGVVAGRPVHVTLLIGTRQTKLVLALVRQIHALASQVALVEVGAAGRNALDITLACYLGQEIQRSPGAEFFVVSGDKDYDVTLEHLKASGVKVSRHESFQALPFLNWPKVNEESKSPFEVTKAPQASKPAARSLAATEPKAKAATGLQPGLDKKMAKFVQHVRNSPPANQTKLEHMITAFFKPMPTGGMKGVLTKLKGGKFVEIDPSGRVTVADR